jgi:simple sugar transport system permease protein
VKDVAERMAMIHEATGGAGNEDGEERVKAWAELVFRSLLSSGGRFVASNPREYLGIDEPAETELAIQVGQAVLGLILDQPEGHLGRIFGREALEAVILTIITASTPLLLAAMGELVVERSGVLNLGVEGMMVMGAVSGFGAAYLTGNPYIGVIAAIVAGIIMSVLFGILTLTLVANQVATGLALTLLGLGLSGLLGEAFVGVPGVKLGQIYIPVLTDIPFIGPILFGQDPLVYLSIIIVIAVSYVLTRTRAGLIIRAVGDNHASAHALGYGVIPVRYACVMFGGACAGLAGGYLSLAYTPQWIENMTAGRGWIALALVVFATWLPKRVAIGAYLFGTVWIMGLYVQGIGVGIPSQFLSSLPYLVTIIVLVINSSNRTLMRTNTPACIGQPFVPDR